MQTNNEAAGMIEEMGSAVRSRMFGTAGLNRIIELSIALRDRHLTRLGEEEKRQVLSILRVAKVHALSHDAAYSYLEHLQLLEKDISSG
ncbi:MAG: hypothetical protein PHS02_02000 [Candidatus ainarchaeum sp.]|nr:hypothetical protein [Candidatus ainarchaeum sp.]